MEKYWYSVWYIAAEGAADRNQQMTLAEAKRLYIAAVEDIAASDEWWQEVREEMESIVAARSDRAAGKLIEWWCDWDRELSATKQARLIREEWARMKS